MYLKGSRKLRVVCVHMLLGNQTLNVHKVKGPKVKGLNGPLFIKR